MMTNIRIELPNASTTDMQEDIDRTFRLEARAAAHSIAMTINQQFGRNFEAQPGPFIPIDRDGDVASVSFYFVERRTGRIATALSRFHILYRREAQIIFGNRHVVDHRHRERIETGLLLLRPQYRPGINHLAARAKHPVGSYDVTAVSHRAVNKLMKYMDRRGWFNPPEIAPN